MRPSVRLVIAALLMAATATAIPSAASASCDQTRQISPHAFTGTVQSTEYEGRVARVRTDDGRDVTVIGTPADLGGARPGETVATSVDRTYSVGARYEFHPTNDASPYADNACTATRWLSAGAPGGSDTAGLPAGWLIAGAAVLLAGLGIIIWWLSRGRRPAADT